MTLFSVALLYVPQVCLKAHTPTRDFQEPKRMRLSSPLLKRLRSRCLRWVLLNIWSKILIVIISRGKKDSLTAKPSPSHGQI